jgi:hypothetical protein
VPEGLSGSQNSIDSLYGGQNSIDILLELILSLLKESPVVKLIFWAFSLNQVLHDIRCKFWILD